MTKIAFQCIMHYSDQIPQEVQKGDEILHIDGGPMYTETNVKNTIPEPVNTLSAAIFMFIAIYWWYKASKQASGFRFLKLSAIILAIGGLGGTIYHGLRIYEWAMWMDWIPIVLLCIAAAAYFVYLLFKNIYLALLSLVLAVLLQYLNFTLIPDSLNTSTSYAILAIYVLLPITMALVKTQYLYWIYPIAALGAFVVALTFRIADREQWLQPIGTHFLWHTFGAVACHAMFTYLFLFKRAFPRFELVNKIRFRNIRIEFIGKMKTRLKERKNKSKSGT